MLVILLVLADFYCNNFIVGSLGGAISGNTDYDQCYPKIGQALLVGQMAVVLHGPHPLFVSH